MKIAAVTMVYNEPDMLPFWLRHYASQLGADSCYVVDHGTTDGSTTGIAANVIRIPRTDFNDNVRADFLSELCSSLLKWYDWVIYADVDEILLPNAEFGQSLHEYCAGDRPDVVTAFGLNMVHRLHHEVELDPHQKILSQHRWAFPFAALSKPSLTRVPIRWTPGFHTANAPVVFDGLLNFHLAHVDLPTALRRQAKRRTVIFSNKDPNNHHLTADTDLQQMIENWSKMPLIEDATLADDCPYMTEFMQRILGSQAGHEDDLYKIEMNIAGDHLWKIPTRFVGAF